MSSHTQPTVTFLAFENPLVVNDGYSSRVNGLFRQLAKAYPLHLITLTRQPFTPEEQAHLKQYTKHITRIARCDRTLKDKLLIGLRALSQRIPYHAALITYSLAQPTNTGIVLPSASAVVYANGLQWTLPIRNQHGRYWIYDQQNADVHFWQLYAQHSNDILVRWVAQINHRVTLAYCRDVYPHAARIVAVCDEDQYLTQQFTPNTPVDVIANGVDCDFFTPQPQPLTQPTILFTGTSAERNMQALRYFVRHVYPRVHQQVPQIRFIVGGNFSAAAQRELQSVPGIMFTGKVPDMRPVFGQARIFVNPFTQAYGSKLKVSEALAMGMCIVSLREGVRGMPVVNGESVLLADSSEEMAQQIIRALHDPQLVERIGANARRVAEEQLDWERVLGPQLRHIAAATWQTGTTR